jgi:Cd2+/Zn2+-exporting ATPase
MHLTEEAQLNKPKLQRWLDEFGERYSQAIVVVSAVVALFGPFVFKWPFIGTPGARGSIYRALGLMVAVSPCALAVAPLAYATAISACASKGILLKGGHALDALASCDTIVFDKTGTLTTGGLVCKGIEPIHGHSLPGRKDKNVNACCNPSCEKEALAVASAMEKGTTHPIARAVADHSEGKELPPVSIEHFESLPGKGLVATLTGIQISAALDASIDIVGGRVNIHVLMTLAAFASVFMGNTLEGGLLLAMFNLAHIAEEYYTKRALGDVKALKESALEFWRISFSFDSLRGQ